MPSWALIVEPEGGYMEELPLPPLVTAQAFVNDLPPIPSRQGKEANLIEQNKGSVGPEELLKGELILKHLEL